MGINCCTHEKEPPEITINAPEKNCDIDVVKKRPNSVNNNPQNELIIVNPNQSSLIQQSIASNGSASSIIIPHTDQNSPRALNNLVNLKNFYINNSPENPQLIMQKENQGQNIYQNTPQLKGINGINTNNILNQQQQNSNTTGEERESAINRAYAYEIIQQGENNQSQNYVIVDKLFEQNPNNQLRSKFDNLFKQESNEIDNAFFDYLVSLNSNSENQSRNRGNENPLFLSQQIQPKTQVNQTIHLNNINQFAQVNPVNITVQSDIQKPINPLYMSQQIPNNTLLLNDNNIV